MLNNVFLHYLLNNTLLLFLYFSYILYDTLFIKILLELKAKMV